MSGWERWALRVGCLAVAVTGIVYGALRYFVRVQGEFGPEPSAWQSPFQHLHVLAAPVLVFGLGAALRGHALGMLRHHVTRGRKTGILLIAMAAPMVLSGYFVQIVTDTHARSIAAWAHGISSSAFVLFYLVHWLKRAPARSVAPSAPPMGTVPTR